MELANCCRCGRLFAKTYKDECPNCLKEIEADYVKCVDYLHKERQSSVSQLSEGTGVSINQITKFIREGRISATRYPNMHYGCETCGCPILEGNICERCRRRLLGDIKRFSESEDQNSKHSTDYNRISTYQIMNDLNDE